MSKGKPTPNETKFEVSKAFNEQTNRETRLIDAATMLKLAIKVINPPDCKESEDPIGPLTFEDRFALLQILHQTKEALEENIDKFCGCYEKKKYGDEVLDLAAEI